jgi:hypothetical protein
MMSMPKKIQTIGASMTRDELDTKNNVSDVSFWDLLAHNTKRNYRLNEIFFDSKKNVGINPELFFNHSATEVYMMWKILDNLYNDARSKYTT